MTTLSTHPAPPPSLDDWLEWRDPANGRVLRRTFLMLAAQDGSLPLLEAALLRGASVNLQSPDDGVTALIAGASSSALEPSTGNSVALDTIKLLLRYGADRDLKDHAGRSPLDIFLGSGLFTSSIQQMTNNNPPPPPPQRQELTLEADDSDGQTAALPPHAPSRDDDLVDATTVAKTPEALPVQTVHRDQDNTPHTCAEFRMFRFKIEDCPNEVACEEADWTECPFAHPGEKARRRDPKLYQYNCTPCPDFRKGSCKRGDGCGFAHGVFEGWLHSQKYRTQMCKEGAACSRVVCFFAHTPTELREAVEPPPQAPRQPQAPAPEHRGCSPFTQPQCLDDAVWGCPPALAPGSKGGKPFNPFRVSSAALSAPVIGRASHDGHTLLHALPNRPSLQSLELPAKPQSPDILVQPAPSPRPKFRPSALEPPNSPLNHFDCGVSLSTRSSIDPLPPRTSMNGRVASSYSSRSSSPAIHGPLRSAPHVPRPRKSLQSSLALHGHSQSNLADRLMQAHGGSEQAQAYCSQQQQQQQQQQLHQLLQHQSWKLAQSTQQTQQLQQELLSTLNLGVNSVSPMGVNNVSPMGVNSVSPMWHQHHTLHHAPAPVQPPSNGIHLQEASMMGLARSASSASSMSRMWPVQEGPMPALPPRHSLSGPAWPMGMESLLQDRLMAAALMEMSPAGADATPAISSELVSWLSKGGSCSAASSNPHLAPEPAGPYGFHAQPFGMGNNNSFNNNMFM